MANAYHGLKNFEDAAANFEKGLEIEPGNAQMKQQLDGVMRDMMGGMGGGGGPFMGGRPPGGGGGGLGGDGLAGMFGPDAELKLK